MTTMNNNSANNNNTDSNSSNSNHYLKDYQSSSSSVASSSSQSQLSPRSPTYRENDRCTFCQEIKPFLIEEEVYYNQGRNKRIAYLCCSEFFHKNDNPCHETYLRDLGFDGSLIVAGCNGSLQQSYAIIRSVYISCPLLPNAAINMITKDSK